MRIENTDNNNTNTNNLQLDPETIRRGEEILREHQEAMQRIYDVRRQYRNIPVSNQIRELQQQLSNPQLNENRQELQQRLNELQRVWRILHL